MPLTQARSIAADREVEKRFVPPTSLAEAESRRVQLAEKIAVINAQLSNKNQLDERGNRRSGEDYHAWRKKAVWALQYATAEIRRVNLWLKEHNRTAELTLHASGLCFDPRDPISLCRAAFIVFKRARQDGVEFGDDEIAVMNALREFHREHNKGNPSSQSSSE